MRHMDHEEFVTSLHKYLCGLGYRDVNIYIGNETAGVNFGNFDVWILLPPRIHSDGNSTNNSREYSNHVGSLRCNLTNCRDSPKLKVVIHSNLNQSESFDSEYGCKQILRYQEQDKKWMVKDIPVLNKESVGTSLGEGMKS